MLIVAGEALIDVITSPDGRTEEVPGGGPFNTARTIARLGTEVAFLGRLSTDARGRRLRSALADDDVDLRFADATDDPTTLAEASIDDAGNARYRFTLDGTSASDLDAGTVQAAIDARPVAVHIGTLGLVMEPVGASLARGVAALGPETLLVVDPNCRPGAIADRAAYMARIRAILGRADVVKVSVDDLEFLVPDRGAEDATVDLLAMGARVVLLTDGGRSARIQTATFELSVPVPSMPVVDTIGAGDAFSGGFLAHWTAAGRGRADLADREALEDATRHGVLVAGLTCGRAGADPPTAAEVAQARGTI